MSTIEQQLSNHLVGERCVRTRLIAGGTLILCFAYVEATKSCAKRIFIDTAWRLWKDDTIKIGALDDSYAILEFLNELTDVAVQSIQVDSTSGDLHLSFKNGFKIESFGYAVVDDNWEFRHSDGIRIGIGANFEPFERFEESD